MAPVAASPAPPACAAIVSGLSLPAARVAAPSRRPLPFDGLSRPFSQAIVDGV
jgi:hypothetical protein